MKALIINCSPVRNGATAEIIRLVKRRLSNERAVKDVCIDDYSIAFCKGCRSCHSTARCTQADDVEVLMNEFEKADIIVCVSPSYWADIPGQFKAFIDRCTPWNNTHEPHASISKGKKGYVIALRTGSSGVECERIIQTVKHFYGHLGIECCGALGLTSIESKEDVADRAPQIEDFCSKI